MSCRCRCFACSEAERETGGIAVEVLGAGEITERQPQALEPADALDLGSIVAGRESPSMVAFRFKPVAGTAARALAVRVIRYATQAVQVANVDEARYQVLSTEEGKTLVRARYAVRNNHRSLMSVALPVDATLWSASVAGRVVRPGRAATGALLVPLERGQRARRPAAVCRRDRLSGTRARRGPKRARSRSGCQPSTCRFRALASRFIIRRASRSTAVPGSFRVEPYAEPVSAVLRDNEMAGTASRLQRRRGTGAGGRRRERPSTRSSGRPRRVRVRTRPVGILPLDIPFPEFGSTIYLASELTPETQTAELGIEYHRTRGN